MQLQLKRFYEDPELKEAVVEYFLDFLEKKAIKKVFDREEVSAIPEAKEIIEEAIEHLDIIFKKPASKISTVDEAR